MHTKKPTRRAFIGQMGRLAVGLTLVPLAACETNAFEPVIEGSDIPFLTPTDDFFLQFGADGAIDGWLGIPPLSDAGWQLDIDGLLSQPTTLRLADLRAEPAQTVLATLRCIVNSNSVPGLIGTAAWTGVPLRFFLERAGVDRTRARRLRLYAADGFTDNLPLEKVLGPLPDDLPEPLLVYAMNGDALAPAHGAPVRLLVPGHYGYKSVKWITRIEVTDSDEVFGAYQNLLGYSDDGRIDVTNKVTSHLQSARIAPGPTRLSGYALSGHAGIDRVEVSINGGNFAPARQRSLVEVLATEPDLRDTLQVADEERFSYPFRGVWVLWEFWWNAPAGEYRLRIRATDATGRTQPDTDLDPTDGENPVYELRVTVA